MEYDNELPPEFYRDRHSWPFTRMAAGAKQTYDDKEKFIKAVKAAHTVGTRKKWKFKSKWFDQKDDKPAYGLIARME